MEKSYSRFCHSEFNEESTLVSVIAMYEAIQSLKNILFLFYFMKNIVPPCFYRLSVKALIHDDEWRFLLVKEDNWLWELPWWGIDHGENLQKCLKREIQEEMWLEAVTIDIKPSYFFTSTNRKWFPIANVLFETTLKNLDFTPSEECVEIWFFTLEEARKLETYPNIQEFLKLYNPTNHVHF